MGYQQGDETIAQVSRLINLWAQAMGRSEVELNTLRIFMIVAESGGRPLPQVTIRDRTGLSEAATSRNISVLSTGATPSSCSPGLIESYEDPTCRRRKLVRLTARGHQVLRDIRDAIRLGAPAEELAGIPAGAAHRPRGGVCGSPT